MPSHNVTLIRDSKGKGKRVDGDGIVVELNYVETGVYTCAYTLGLRVGGRDFNVQVDTGSSDMWIASTDCPAVSPQSCGNIASSSLYDPSSSDTVTEIDEEFSITYLEGSTSGPIYLDTVDIGGYSIESQAFAATSTIVAEELSQELSGILGLALQGNSIIYRTLLDSSNQGGGDIPVMRLFADEDVGGPQSRFISLTLSRPDSKKIPSLMGLGRHPDAGVLKSDTLKDGDDYKAVSNITYTTPIRSSAAIDGVWFWKTGVEKWSVWVDGEEKPVTLGAGLQGGQVTAVLDSGIPFILTSRVIADGVYGALGIGPGSDGMYYVPCDKPLNMTITLEGRDPLPLHPLDITTNVDSSCIGLLQARDNELAQAGIADIILGVPFLRSVYMVMTYAVPLEDGSFPDRGSSSSITPRLGLLSLLDAGVAMKEFERVRLHNLPIDDGGSTGGSPNSNGDGGKKGLGAGYIALIAIMAVIGGCVLLFGLRWLFVRRQLKKEGRTAEPNSPFPGAGNFDPAGTSSAVSGVGGWWKRRRPKSVKRQNAGRGEYELASRGEALEVEESKRREKFESYLSTKNKTSEFNPYDELNDDPLNEGELPPQEDPLPATAAAIRPPAGLEAPDTHQRYPSMVDSTRTRDTLVADYEDPWDPPNKKLDDNNDEDDGVGEFGTLEVENNMAGRGSWIRQSGAFSYLDSPTSPIPGVLDNGGYPTASSRFTLVDPAALLAGTSSSDPRRSLQSPPRLSSPPSIPEPRRSSNTFQQDP